MCAKYGIQIYHSIPYTPHKNGVEERKNRALKEMTTYMMEAKGLDANIWDEAMNVVAYIHNRVPHSFIKRKNFFRSILWAQTRCVQFHIFQVHCLGSNST